VIDTRQKREYSVLSSNMLFTQVHIGIFQIIPKE
jgi:hypothetical protein